MSVPVVAAIVLDDQLTKAAATRAGLAAHNPSYALGVVGGPTAALIAGTIVVLVAFLAFVARPAVALGVSPIAPALIVGGMFGNALDRIRFGAARDFLVTPWAIVNVADLAVAAGIVAFAVAVAWRLYRLRLESSGIPVRAG
ncbi:MAG: signal peptidase II [Actinomycetota bacterium]|nr:signal peptidase II [Actinomycetota bacterium]